MLVHMLEKRRGLSTNRATSPAMWRPTGASGVRGRSGGGPARGEKGGDEPGDDVWKATASRRWPAALPWRRAAPLCADGSGSREGERRKMTAGLVSKFRKV